METITDTTTIYDDREACRRAVIDFTGEFHADYDIDRIIEDAFVQGSLDPNGLMRAWFCHLSPEEFGRIVDRWDRTAHVIEIVQTQVRNGHEFFAVCSCGERSNTANAAGFIHGWISEHRDEVAR